VVVPAFGEERRIASTVARLRSALEGLAADGGVELIVVDDGSTDSTASRSLGAGADRVIRLPVNRGKGAAVRAGVLAAAGSTIVFTDADLSYPPSQVVRVLGEVEQGWDVVVGSRRHNDTQTSARAGRLREMSGRVFNLVTRLVLVPSFSDTQCGLKGFQRDAAQALFTRGRVDGFAFDVELLWLAGHMCLAVKEIPVELDSAEGSTVHLSMDALRMVRDLVRVRWWARAGTYGPADSGGAGASRPGSARLEQPSAAASRASDR